MPFLRKVKEKYIIAGLSPILYHSTSIKNAVSILQENNFRLSTWLGTPSDLTKNTNKLWYLSTSRRKGAYGGYVVFVLDGNKLSHNYKGMPVDYWGTNFIDVDEAEDRILSDKPTIPNADKYIKEIHVNWYTVGDPDWKPYIYKNFRNLYLLAKKYNIPIYWYEDEKAFKLLNKNKTKKFSDFEKERGLTSDELKTRQDLRPYSFKKWKALLSIQPAKKKSDLPSDITKFISPWYKTDAISGYSADIHNVIKQMKKEELPFVYKLQRQMKQEGAKDLKEFIEKMLNKLNNLLKENEN